jgi:hypothetical protein
MGVGTWLVEHSPMFRAQRVRSSFRYDGLESGFRTAQHEMGGYLLDQKFAASLALLALTPGPDEIFVAPSLAVSASIDAAAGRGIFYDPQKLDRMSFGLPRAYTVHRKSMRSSRRSGGPVSAKTPGGTKPSRRASPGKTSKPFWSEGKPKCKKGFRYDYKRKLCVKIK